MATREEVVKLTIESAEAAKSVKEVRESLKAIRDQMMAVGDDSKEFHQLAAAAAELKDRVNDANEAMAAMHPDGFQAVTNFAAKASGAVQGVTGAMALFGGESEEVQKTMMKLQAAMALTQGLESLKDMSKAWKALNAVIAANPVLAIIAAVLALAAAAKAVYDWFVEQNSEAAKLEEQAKQIEAVEGQKVKQMESQMRILQAQGASEEVIYQALMKQLDAQIRIAQAKLLAAKQRAIEEDYEEEEMKAFQDAANEFAKLLTDKKVAQIEYQNWQQEQRDKEVQAEADKNQKISDQYRKDLDERKKHSDAIRAMMQPSEQEMEAEAEMFSQQMQQEIEANRIKNEQILADEKAAKEESLRFGMWKIKMEEQARAAQEAREKMMYAARVDLARGAFGALSELSGKNAKLQKAFAVAETTISTYQAAQKAYASQLALATPDAPIRAALAAGIAIASGLARVAAILRVDEKSGGGGASPTGGGGGMGLATINSAPDVNTAQQPSTLINEQGQAMNQQQQAPVYVAVTEIREVSNNVNVVENLARF